MITTASVRDEIGSVPDSLRGLAGSLGLNGQLSLRTLLGRHAQPVEFFETILTEDALGGSHSVRLFRNGQYRYTGHLRATGWPSFNVSLLSTVGTNLFDDGTGPSIQVPFHAQGRAHGTDEPGSREVRWSMRGSNDIIANQWAAVRRGSLRHTLKYQPNYLGAFGDIGSRIAAVVFMGAMFGPTGVAIALAGDVAEVASLNELILPGLVGVVLSAGAAFLITPGLMIPVFIAGAAITPALIKQKKMDADERTFADAVFNGKIDYDRILLTNLTGFGDRGFAAPGPGSVIYVNLGKGYDDPRGWAFNAAGDKTRAPGHLFIHELTHAWQICNDEFTPLFYCEAIGQQIKAADDRPAVYNYGLPDREWSEFGTEQQANIVADWFAGNTYAGSGRAQAVFPPKDQTANPFWPYVRDHVWSGIT